MSLFHAVPFLQFLSLSLFPNRKELLITTASLASEEACFCPFRHLPKNSPQQRLRLDEIVQVLHIIPRFFVSVAQGHTSRATSSSLIISRGSSLSPGQWAHPCRYWQYLLFSHLLMSSTGQSLPCGWAGLDSVGLASII